MYTYLVSLNNDGTKTNHGVFVSFSIAFDKAMELHKDNKHNSSLWAFPTSDSIVDESILERCF